MTNTPMERCLRFNRFAKRMRGLGCVSIFSMVLATQYWASGIAHADESKRPVPDYDGRGPAPTTAGEVALWVPRIILSPLYLVSEYIIREPLGFLIASAERADLPRILYDFFAFGPDHKAGFAPIALFDFGFNPSVGVYLFWDDAFFPGNDLRLHGSTWTSDWQAISLTDRVHFHRKDVLTFNLAFVRRPDHVFYGLGPSTPKQNQSRYGEEKADGRVTIDFPLWRASRVRTTAGVRYVNLYPGHFGGDPSLERESAAGAFPLPYGFNRGYTAQYNHVLAAFDTRQPRPHSGSGVRVEVEAEQGSDVRRAAGSGWLRYGGALGGFLDLNEHSRIVSVSVTALFADPLGSEPVPFTELVALGGDGPMRGFWPGRLVDRSAAVATARYRWPIAPFVYGTMEAAVGNVFGTYLRELKPGLLRMTGAIGIESVGSLDNALELLFGVGTETFDHGGQVDSLVLSVGTNRGF
jgi:Omp85 superfamily domain